MTEVPTSSETSDATAVKTLVETLIREQLATLVANQIAAFVQQNEQRAREFSLLERVVRVEEELKSLRELQVTQFAAIEKRFEALQREMSARFEAVDKRFEAMDKRFTMIQWTMGLGFTLVIAFMGMLKLI